MTALAQAQDLLSRGECWAGLGGDALAFVLAQVAADGRWLVVLDEPDQADRLERALRFFHPQPRRIRSFPADDVMPYDGFSPSPEIPRARLRTLAAAARGDDLVVVTSAAALLQRVPSLDEVRKGMLVVRSGMLLERDDLVRQLSEAAYLSTSRVAGDAQFAVRGDVLDVWPAGASKPVRIDFFDDEVEDVRRLDPATQRAGSTLPSVTLLPGSEQRLDAAALRRASVELARWVDASGRPAQLRRRILEDLKSGVRFAGLEALLPALCETVPPLEAFAGFQVIVVHPDDVGASARELLRRATERYGMLDDDERPLVPPEARYANAADTMAGLAEGHPVLEFARGGEAIDLGARPLDGFGAKTGELAPVVKKLTDLSASGLRVVLVVEKGSRADVLVEMLAHHHIEPVRIASPWDAEPEEISLVEGELPRGFLAEPDGWVFVPASALFGAKKAKRSTSMIHAFFDVGVSDLSQLKEGDHVVHRVHGIGLYRGLTRVPVGDGEQDFVQLEYRGGDLMYLPATRLSHLSRYSPARQQPKVTLDRLGGQTWTSRTGKVRDSVLKMATELLKVHARRELAEREPYPEPGDRFYAFEAGFPYQETPDQEKAIRDVLADLSGEEPMDRLVVGDVGFGKTEVAMRGAMRVVEAGKQVVVLCPTTVLAFQHLSTFRERFSELGVRVEMLSRFVPAAEAKAVKDGLRSGEVDIVVGTTMLLGRGVGFKDLGLLVVDEEHRFGVKQKEKVKKLRAAVDILSMSATPIPRTLEMALSGLRDMSVMATPPEERLAVRTTVTRFRKTRIRDAILREIERGGQVYFVHNRVQDIATVAETLREWVPEARVAIAHGQMAPDKLEGVLVDFIKKSQDVLVCSAIIETGVDLPNVNTMVVNRADLFGLSQLYQLRGRVGRGASRGHCILVTPEEMSRDARKRLRVIVEATQLGAGFDVAAADLELRGGGNLVGDAQSGNIDAVGYEMWLELLAEAVQEARGEVDRGRVEPEVSVPVPAFIPDNLVTDLQDRLQWYKRLSSAESPERVDALLEELELDVGDAPPPLENLAGLVRTEAYCRELAIEKLAWLKVRFVMVLHPSSPLKPELLEPLLSKHRKRVTYTRREGQGDKIEVRFTPTEAERPFRFLRWWFTQLRKVAQTRR